MCKSPVNENISITSNNIEKLTNENGKQKKELKCITFDEALNLTGFGKFNIFSVMFCGLILFGMVLETLGFSYIIPASQCDLKLTLGQKGWIAAIPFMGTILTSHMWGYLADTRGRKKVLIYAMIIGSNCSILSSFSPNLITFIILRFIASIFIACPAAICYAYLGEVNPSRYRDKMVILANSIVVLGSGVLALIAWAVLSLDFKVDIFILPDYFRPWRLLVSIFALPFVMCAFLFIYFPESPKFLQINGKSEETMNILRKIYACNTGKSPNDYPVKEISVDIEDKNHVESHPNSLFWSIWHQTAPLFKPPYVKYTLLTSYLQFITYASTNGFYMWFPTVIDKVLNDYKLSADNENNICSVLNNFSKNSTTITNTQDRECIDSLNTESFSYTILLSVAKTLIVVVTAFTMVIFGKRNILAFVLLVSASCGISVHWIGHKIFSIAMFSAIQFSGACTGIISAFVVEIFPTNFRAMAVCLTTMVGRFGSIFGTNIVSYLMENDCSMSFFVFSGLLYFSVLVCYALPKAKKDKKQNEVEMA